MLHKPPEDFNPDPFDPSWAGFFLNIDAFGDGYDLSPIPEKYKDCCIYLQGYAEGLQQKIDEVLNPIAETFEDNPDAF